MACVGCRSVRVKCEKQANAKCKRCDKKKLDCVLHTRKRRTASGVCERCYRLHQACSLTGEAESDAPCKECVRRNAVCEPFDPKSKCSKVDTVGEEPSSVESLSIVDKEENLSLVNRTILGLALRAPMHFLCDELEKLPPAEVPAVFGLGRGTLGQNWLLISISPPGPDGFTHEGFHKGTRILTGVVRAPFDALFDLSKAKGKSWWDLQCCKTQSEFDQLKCMLQVAPGPAHVRVALEVTRLLADVGETAIVLHSVFDTSGIACLQFLSFSMVDRALLSTRDRSAFADLEGLEWLDDFELGAVSMSSLDDGMQFFDLEMIL